MNIFCFTPARNTSIYSWIIGLFIFQLSFLAAAASALIVSIPSVDGQSMRMCK